MKQGFTLIELLVVVLIIGILASIAVPQYEKAVLRSRFSGAQQVAESIRKAQEIYFVANNQYTPDTENLDYDYQGSCTGADILQCDNHFYIDNLENAGLDQDSWNVKIYHCPAASSWEACRANSNFIYSMWLDQSSHPGLRECRGITQEGRDFCLMLEE